jgi:hypothetical protein
LECVPHKTLRFTWAGGDVVGTTVHHALEEIGDGSLLRFEHSGFDLDAAWGEQALKGAEYGRNVILGQLNDLVTTKP